MIHPSFFILMLGVLGIVIITARILFGDWDKTMFGLFNVAVLIIGVTLTSTGLVLNYNDMDQDVKVQKIYYDNLKSNIRNMDCKTLGVYIIDNADNSTLNSEQILTLAHGVYGVKCK